MGKPKPVVPNLALIPSRSRAEIERRIQECLEKCSDDLGLEYVVALVVARQSLNDSFFDLLQADRT